MTEELTSNPSTIPTIISHPDTTRTHLSPTYESNIPSSNPHLNVHAAPFYPDNTNTGNDNSIVLSFFNTAGKLDSANQMIGHLTPDLCFLTEIRKRKGPYNIKGQIIAFEDANATSLMACDSSSRRLETNLMSSSKCHQLFNVYGIFIMSIYKPPKLSLDKFLEIITPALNVAKDHPLIIAGDFNISPIKKDKSNNQFIKMCNTLEEFGLVWSPIETHAFSFSNHVGNSLIDHIFVNAAADELIDYACFSWEFYDSDHRAILVRLTLPHHLESLVKRRRLNLSKINDAKLVKRFKRLVELHLAEMDRNIEYMTQQLRLKPRKFHKHIVSEFDEYFNSCIYTIAKSVFGE
jgi:hypothetical protein